MRDLGPRGADCRVALASVRRPSPQATAPSRLGSRRDPIVTRGRAMRARVKRERDSPAGTCDYMRRLQSGCKIPSWVADRILDGKAYRAGRLLRHDATHK